MGASSANSGRMAQTTIHFRVARRYGRTWLVSLTWKAQLARSSEGKLNAARRPDTSTKESVSGRRSRPDARPQAHDRHRRAESAVGRQEQAMLQAARDGLADEMEDRVFDGMRQQQAVEGAGDPPAQRAGTGGAGLRRLQHLARVAAIERQIGRGADTGGAAESPDGARPEAGEERIVGGGPHALVEAGEPEAGEPVQCRGCGS